MKQPTMSAGAATSLKATSGGSGGTCPISASCSQVSTKRRASRFP